VSDHRNARVGVAASYNPDRLFLLSCISLIAAAFVFSLRAAIMEDLGRQFGLTGAQTGWIMNSAFLGFALSVFVGSPLCDYMGMGRLLALAAVCHIVGTLATVFSPSLAAAMGGPAALLWGAQFTVGLAHGLVEAVINPLCATVYPDNKTHKLNVLHAWWPGGLAVGGLLAVGVTQVAGAEGVLMGLQAWQVKFAIVLIPAVIYGVMLFGQKFPPTERVASGVSTSEMFTETLKPLFILLLLCMLLTASLELGPGQWVDAVLKNVGMPGILVLVYVSALMFIFRFFAGGLAHRLSPVGLMFLSSILAGIGLFMLGRSDSIVTALVAATVWGFGVCYMWPTMLGIASERFPRTGAFGMGLIGSFGNIAIYFALPAIGSIRDKYTQEHLQGVDMKGLIDLAKTDPNAAAQLDAAQAAAAPFAFGFTALLAVPLAIVFGLWWLMDKKRGGYQVVKLQQADPGDFSADAVKEAEASPA